MNICRGDIALARFPHDSGGRGKKRPVEVIQADVYNRQLRHTVVAEITGNLLTATDPTNLLVEIGSGDGSQSGLTHDSVITCWHLLTINEQRIGKIIGSLSPTLLQKLNVCLKAALQIA